MTDGVMEEKAPRTIDELIDLPYSEMSEEEIEIVIDFRAGVKARDEAYVKQLQEQRAHNLAMEQIAREKTEAAKAALQAMNDLATQQLAETESRS